MISLQHMRYALEVERQGSISRAAEALYMNQPNLSKAIRELEAALGVTVFGRTPKGITVTREGARFLAYARGILAQVDEMEARYRPGSADRQSLRVSAPGGGYIAGAFTDFVAELDMGKEIDLCFCEADPLGAIQNIMEEGYRLGIIRYRTAHESHILALLNERELGHREVLDFESLVVFSAEGPLAQRESVSREELLGLIEVIEGDPRTAAAGRPGPQDLAETRPPRRVYACGRGGLMDLLARNPHTFMWGAPAPHDMLGRAGLAQRRCSDGGPRHKDILIYPRGYSYTPLEKAFLIKVEQAAERVKRPGRS